MLARCLLTLALALALALPARAGPRDEALRLAPNDFALTVVVQDLRAHIQTVTASPFAAWFPTSTLGKKLLGSTALKSATDAATPIFTTLGVTPTDLFHDILGDAVVFAYAPATGTRDERSVILLRPRKPELLADVIGKLNEAQIQSKELKAVLTRKHAGESYFERQKSEGPSEFYCFRGGVLAQSQSEAEIKAVIDRDRTSPNDKPPELVARMKTLGVASAAVVLLINPRPFDEELTTKVKNAHPNERRFLMKFAEAWRASEAAAVYCAFGVNMEVGLSVRFDPTKVPSGAKSWLVGARTPSVVWSAIPESALAAVCGRMKPTELLDSLVSLNADGEPTPREAMEQLLGPIMGKDKLPVILDSLGPDWGVWVLPPTEHAIGAKGKVPVVVAAVRVQGPKRVEASKSLRQSLEYAFQAARIAYNARHKAQIALREDKDGDTVITSLSGDGLPTGFLPCFTFKGEFLLVSTSPDAIRSFQPPMGEPKPSGEVPLVRFNATTTRAYLTSHATMLAKLLATAGAGDKESLSDQLAGLAALLEPVDRVELLAHGNTAGFKLLLRAKMVKPLKK